MKFVRDLIHSGVANDVSPRKQSLIGSGHVWVGGERAGARR